MNGPRADRIEDKDGRQYHIGVAPGELAARIIMVGDPARADLISGLFDSVRVTRRNREYVTHTGTWEGLEVSVMATGIGCDNTEIALMELLRCERNPVLIRVGSCGGLQPEIDPGDLVISTGSLRLEGTSSGFVHDAYPAIAHHEVVLALVSAARETAVPMHLGLTATAAGFYGWQGRSDSIVPSIKEDLPDELRRQGVLNFEMEASTLFVLAQLAKVRAGAVCAVFANRPENRFIEPDAKQEAELRAIHTGLNALKILDDMDRRRVEGLYRVSGS